VLEVVLLIGNLALQLSHLQPRFAQEPRRAPEPVLRKRVLWSGSYAILRGGAPLEVLKQYIQGQRKPPE